MFLFMHFLDLTWCVAYYYPLDIIRDVDFCIKDIALGMFLIFCHAETLFRGAKCLDAHSM